VVRGSISRATSYVFRSFSAGPGNRSSRHRPIGTR
jgi:hypothetical protein